MALKRVVEQLRLLVGYGLLPVDLVWIGLQELLQDLACDVDAVRLSACSTRLRMSRHLLKDAKSVVQAVVLGNILIHQNRWRNG
jgi:hypothetical protein